MSFSEDPYRVMTIINNLDGTCRWSCDSCGGGWRGSWPDSVSVFTLRADFDRHVEQSHGLTIKDTRGWSVP
jgi:uncharacterized C2H2 Zn-finger protein